MLLVSKSSAMDEPTTDPQSGRRQCTIYILGISGVKKWQELRIFGFGGLYFCCFACVFFCACISSQCGQGVTWQFIISFTIVHLTVPKANKNVDLLGLGLCDFSPFVDNFCSWVCANHIGDITKYLNQCRGFVEEHNNALWQSSEWVCSI